MLDNLKYILIVTRLFKLLSMYHIHTAIYNVDHQWQADNPKNAEGWSQVTSKLVHWCVTGGNHK